MKNRFCKMKKITKIIFLGGGVVVEEREGRRGEGGIWKIGDVALVSW